MKVYIAGPMSNRPDFNYPAFERAEVDLLDAGFEVANPTRALTCCPPGDHSWQEYMQATLAMLVTSGARGVVLLPGWDESRGARLEEIVASTLGWPVFPLHEWLYRPAQLQAEFGQSPSKCGACHDVA